MLDQTNNKIFLIIGPSGVGKNVIIKELLKRIPSLKFLPSYTSRPKRSVEIEGREHFFVTKKEFDELIKEKKLLEYEEVHPGLFYGLPLKETTNLLMENNLIRDLDIKGCLNVKKVFPKNTILIFIKPPSVEVLKNRILNRGNTTQKEMEDRLKRVEFELERANLADYQAINDVLEICIQEVQSIIENELNK